MARAVEPEQQRPTVQHQEANNNPTTVAKPIREVYRSWSVARVLLETFGSLLEFHGKLHQLELCAGETALAGAASNEMRAQWAVWKIPIFLGNSRRGVQPALRSSRKRKVRLAGIAGDKLAVCSLNISK